MSQLGNVYLIPTPLYPESIESITDWTKNICTQITHFYVENIRTARRVLKKYNSEIHIDSLHFEEINHRSEVNVSTFIKWLQEGHDIGIMSEAGMPAIADPGNILVAKAHELGAKVMPVSGPSSILLALCASGMNGQAFTFHGYLPIKHPELQKKIHVLENGLKQGYTQIFIETPFRNMALIQTLIEKMSPNYKLCVACDLTAENEFICTLSLKQWKEKINSFDFHKRPAIFLLSL